MKPKFIVTAVLALGILLPGCVMNKLDSGTRNISLLSDGPGKPIRIDVSIGPEYVSRQQTGPFIFNVLPQMAMWSEDADGNLLQTLYVTGADYAKMRHAAKSELGIEFYRECLPLWALKAEAAGNKLPSKGHPYPDSLTSATPGADFILESRLVAQKPAVLRLEINKSGDENATYSKELNDWAGQPSLIYTLELGDEALHNQSQMALIGHGGRLIDPPAVYCDLSGFDSALKQLSEIRVTVSP